ncbi:helix-turn-helix domain-containing protein [Synergistaceae bacterium OttesenSCG-928-I11]|nr:helix-turn-helix domain-containing protein [Synergistaceae bacterium OttesenSCG-928-I11]
MTKVDRKKDHSLVKLTFLYEELVGLASGGESLDAVLEAASRSMRQGVAYVDPDGVVLSAHSDRDDFVEKVRFLPLNELKRLYTAIPLHEAGDRTGHLILQHGGAESERHMAALRLAVRVYWNIRDAGSRKLRIYAEKFLKKLPDRTVPEELEDDFRAMKVDFSAGIQVIVGAFVETSEDAFRGEHRRFFERLDARLRNVSRNYISRLSNQKGRNYVAVISPPRSTDLRSLTKNLVEICTHEAARHYGEAVPGVALAVGAPRENPLDIQACCREAQKTLQISLRRGASRLVVAWDELGSFKLISHIASLEEATAFCRRTLKSIALPGFGDDELLETLVQLDRNNWNLREVSRKMFYHHNTIKNRYARIQEIVGEDLSDAETRFHISLAIRILQCLPEERNERGDHA